MKSSDILRSTNFTYNNLFIKKILDYNLSLSEFILLNYFINYNVIDLNIDEFQIIRLYLRIIYLMLTMV